ncbi:hypothetical protein PV350_02140 [Streptomyces sp. PA03-6a]|nr:hypothetical protein [Streptomyces sp. PA03-6a]
MIMPLRRSWLRAEVASFAVGPDLLELGIVSCSRRRPDRRAEQ